MNPTNQINEEIGQRAQHLDNQYTIQQRMKLQRSSIQKLFGATFLYLTVIGIFNLLL